MVHLFPSNMPVQGITVLKANNVHPNTLYQNILNNYLSI